MRPLFWWLAIFTLHSAVALAQPSRLPAPRPSSPLKPLPESAQSAAAIFNRYEIKVNTRNSPKLKRAWDRVESDLNHFLDGEIGKPMDAERLIQLRRNIERLIASRELIGSRVLDIRFENPDALNRVILIEIEAGEKVSFGFRGNLAYQRSEILGWIDEIREQGFKRDYQESIRARILKQYLDSGYAAVQVKVLSFEQTEKEERHLTFWITEGVRYEIEKIDFDGNQFFTAQVLREKLTELSSGIIQQGVYSQIELDRGLVSLIEWMRSQGFLSAKSISIRPTFDPIKGRASVTIYLYEGVQTIVRSVRFKGFSAVGDVQADSLLAIREGSPFNPYAFTEGLERLKKTYRNLGYLSVKVANENDDSIVQYSSGNRWVDVSIDLDEGTRYKLSDIQVEGLEKTQSDIVLREFQIYREQYLDESRTLETEARLRRLGIFSKVTLTLEDDPNRPGYKIARASLAEGSPGFVGGGGGLRNDLGLRLFGEVGYTNLWGKNHSIVLQANTNRRFQDYHFIEYQTTLSYIWPWVFLGPTIFRPGVTQQKQQFIQLSVDSTILSMSLERRLIKETNLVASLTHTIERISQFLAIDPSDNQDLRIGSLTPAIRLDLRDNPLAPTKGFYASSSLEFAAPAFGSQVFPYAISYTRFQIRLDQYIPFSSKLNLYMSFRSGYLRNLVDPSQYADPIVAQLVRIPLYKQFALGGVNSVRGFRLQEINDQDVAIQGTQTYVNYRLQLDYAIAGPLKFGPFLDAANLRIDSFSFGALRYGTGVGLHYQTPVGPVNFDWGFKVDPRPGESTNEFYFSLGVI